MTVHIVAYNIVQVHYIVIFKNSNMAEQIVAYNIVQVHYIIRYEKYQQNH